MNHPSSNVSAASSMIRPKLLFLSTEDVRPYEDASKVTISLRDQIMAEDGFKLVYGIRSFGYNTNVMNISQRQKNNEIDVELTYLTHELEYQGATTDPTPVASTTTSQIYTIRLSDDNYGTVNNLFFALNNELARILWSGWLVDEEKPKNYFNLTPFIIQFSVENENRMYISLEYNDISVIGGYTIHGSNYSAWQFNDKITKIRIQPTPSNPGLFNLLFTNTNSTDPNRPVCLPTFKLGEGQNPCTAVEFTIDPSTYATYQTETDGLKEEEFTTEIVNVWSTVFWNLKEIGNEEFLDTAAGIYPIDNYFTVQNTPYIGYQVPDIHPIYLDISSTLENSNLTTEGLSKNLLTRQFVVGAQNGNNSYYEKWETPVYYILDSRYISSIELQFKSQQNKWNFFNLEFVLELIIFEVEEESHVTDFVEPTFVMPSDDPLTAQLGRYSSSIQNPYPLLGSGQSRRLVMKDDLDNRRVKRKVM